MRLGWLAQTALLVVQAAGAGGFPWSSWAGALNLLAWLVVSVFLIWGCRPRYRLLGLAVMPVAAVLLLVAYAGGGTASGTGRGTGALLALHAAVMLAALAGFVLAAGLSAFYLWHERRLKRRSASILRLRVPPLETLERLAARTVAASLATLTAGIALGLASLAVDGGRLDLVMGATLLAWGVYATFLLARRRSGLHGRRAARLNLLGFALVALVLPLTHFAA